MMLVESFPRAEYSQDLEDTFVESITDNDYIPVTPYHKQQLAILYATRVNDFKLNQLLVGAGGFGGKTYLGSMLAVQYLQFEEDYTCLVTRRNYAELLDTNSIWDNLVDWCCDEERLGTDDVCDFKQSPSPVITHPNGNKIYFKAFDNEKKKQKFKSASYDRIVNDEASELPPQVLKFQYRSSRNTSDIPLSIINLSNPSGDSTEYLVKKFVDGEEPYIAMDWRDNPFIDKESYENSLNQLDYIDQQYQKFGNWHFVAQKGDLISRNEMESQVVQELSTPIQFSLIAIDLAGKGKDKFAVCRYDFLQNGLECVVDFTQTESAQVEDMLIRFVEKHNPNPNPLTSVIVIEQEGGGSPVYAQRYFQELLQEFNIPVQLKFPKGSKFQRARPLMRRIRNGNVKLLKSADYLDDFIEESVMLDPTGNGKSPNLVDSVSLAHNYLHDNVLNTGSQIRLGARLGK